MICKIIVIQRYAERINFGSVIEILQKRALHINRGEHILGEPRNLNPSIKTTVHIHLQWKSKGKAFSL